MSNFTTYLYLWMKFEVDMKISLITNINEFWVSYSFPIVKHNTHLPQVFWVDICGWTTPRETHMRFFYGNGHLKGSNITCFGFLSCFVVIYSIMDYHYWALLFIDAQTSNFQYHCLAIMSIETKAYKYKSTKN